MLPVLRRRPISASTAEQACISLVVTILSGVDLAALLAAFAASVWINDVFIDSITANTAAGDANALFTFPNGSVIAGQDNVLTVLQDHMGNDEGMNRECISCVQCALTDDDDFVTFREIGPWHPWLRAYRQRRKVLDLEGPGQVRRVPEVRPFVLCLVLLTNTLCSLQLPRPSPRRPQRRRPLRRAGGMAPPLLPPLQLDTPRALRWPARRQGGSRVLRHDLRARRPQRSRRCDELPVQRGGGVGAVPRAAVRERVEVREARGGLWAADAVPCPAWDLGL